MFQISAAVEVQFQGKVATLATGFGVAQFANLPWWRNLFAVIRQGAPGARRYGVIFFGMFVTLQLVEMAVVQAALVAQSSAHGQKTARGLRS